MDRNLKKKQNPYLNVIKYVTLVVVGIILTIGAHAERINIILGADPQFGFYPDYIATHRTAPTMIDASEILSRCSDCTKIFAIAGDLSHDGDGRTSYGNAHKAAEAHGIKIIDGVGNHDQFSYAKGETTFGDEEGLFQAGPSFPGIPWEKLKPNYDLMSHLQGWMPYHYKKSKIEYGTTKDGGARQCESFNYRDDRVLDGGSQVPMEYCENEKGYYYTIGLMRPLQSPTLGAARLDNVQAFIVQLHNNFYSDSAVDYLRELKNQLHNDNQLNKPIILVGHQFLDDYSYDHDDDPSTPRISVSISGANKAAFGNITKELNVAAIIHGHYGCEDTNVPEKNAWTL